ncbi:hypothetical protein RSOL_494340, partial [Rhizoctonia solani AG-3 Rhs1AP]
MSDIDENAFDIDYDYPENDITDIDWDLEPESDEPPRDPEPEATTQHQKEYEAVLTVVDCINQCGLKLDDFVYALCYGNPLCTAESDAKDAKRPLKNARRELMKSPSFQILNNLHTHHVILPAAKVKRSEVTVAEAEAALAEDLERRWAPVNKKRYLKSRVAGAKAGEWI